MHQLKRWIISKQKASMRSRFLILMVLLSNIVFAQNTKTDSLKKLINNSEGIEKLELYFVLCKDIYKTQPEYTIELCSQMYEIAEKLKNDTFNIHSLIVSGLSYKVLEKSDLAISFLKQAYDKSIENGNDTKTASIAFEIGSVYLEIDNLDSSLFYNQIALNKYIKIKDLKKQANILNKIGIIYRKYGEYDNAIKTFQEAIKIHEKLDNPLGKASLLTSIGSAYYKFNDFKNAKKFHQEALNIREKLNDEHGIAGSLNNIATNYMKEDSLDKALEYFFKALAINNESGNDKWKSFNLHNIGIIYDMKGEKDKALKYLQQSLEIKESRGDLKGMASTYNSIGFIYYSLEEYEQALAYLQKSLDIGIKLKQRNMLLLAYSNLSGTYLEMGDYKNAYLNLDMYTRHFDTSMSEEKRAAMAEFNSKYETEKKIKENELLKKELELSAQKDKAQKLSLVLLLVALGSSVIFIVFFVLNYRLKKKNLQNEKEIAHNKAENLQKELEYKNRELASNAMFLAQNNELINKIVGDFQKLEKHSNEEGKKLILKLIRELKMHSQDNAWKEFETRFESVHSNFYKNLNEKYPELTPNERKLCAFLRLNMTTKDISALTYQSIRSIETARTRLRKKLDISTDTNLVNFLSGF